MRIGIDIGGVIISEDTDNPGLFFSNDYLIAKEVSDSFLSIKNMIQNESSNNVFIISKCWPDVQNKSKNWLHNKDFFNITGFEYNNIRFCLERREKRNHCIELGIEYFIDDRYSVHRHLQDLPLIKKLFLLNPGESELQLLQKGKKDKIVIAKNWKEIMGELYL